MKLKDQELKNNFVCVCVSVYVYIYIYLPAMQETWIRSLVQEDPLEMGMVTHYSFLA